MYGMDYKTLHNFPQPCKTQVDQLIFEINCYINI